MAEAVERVVEPFDYILPSDLKLAPEKQTVWTFRPMKQRERMAALDNSGTISFDGGKRSINDKTFQQSYEIVLKHLDKVQNFAAGEWPKDDAQRVAYLEKVSDLDIMVLGNAVIERSILHATEKNS